MTRKFPTDDELNQALAGILLEASTVYLFGSIATGHAGSASDVDLAALASQPIGADELARARDELAERLRRDVDLLDLSKASTVMRAQIVSTARLLRDADPSFREQFETTAYSAYARLNEERRGILERIQEEGRIHGG